MTIRELLEAAHLDALGLLEEADHRDFNRAFDRASPEIQAHVRTEQARWAGSHAILLETEPPASLRERVLKAIRAEIEAGATIDNGALGDAVAGVIAHGTVVMAPASMIRVSPAWRAGAIGFASAAALLLAAFVYVFDTNSRLAERVASDQMLGSYVKSFGGDRFQDVVFTDAHQRRVFKAEPGFDADKALAAIHFADTWDKAQLFVKGVAAIPGESFRLVEVDESGAVVRELSQFASNGQFVSLQVPIAASELKPGMRLAIASAAVGQPSSAARLLMTVTL